MFFELATQSCPRRSLRHKWNELVLTLYRVVSKKERAQVLHDYQIIVCYHSCYYFCFVSFRFVSIFPTYEQFCNHKDHDNTRNGIHRSCNHYATRTRVNASWIHLSANQVWERKEKKHGPDLHHHQCSATNVIRSVSRADRQTGIFLVERLCCLGWTKIE